MTRDELLALAKRHADEVFGEETGPLGKSGDVLAAHGIDTEDAVGVALGIVRFSAVPHLEAGRAAIFMQGLIFGLWLSDQEDTWRRPDQRKRKGRS